MKISDIQKEVESGNINVQRHPSLNLFIYNYSKACQFDRNWTDITKKCRGLILDENGTIVARPFEKFFNMEELTDAEIPKEEYEIFEKVDGSLFIVFRYKDQVICATRGSFTSDQALKGAEILKTKNTSVILPDTTYLFEIIYPENKIVVDYGLKEDIVLLAVIDNIRNTELPYTDLLSAYRDHFDIVYKYSDNISFDELKTLNSYNKEGFVIRFKNGFRMKIKFEEYIRLHRILTNISEKTVWEYLKEGRDINELKINVPEEFEKWIGEVKNSLVNKYNSIFEEAKKFYDVELRKLDVIIENEVRAGMTPLEAAARARYHFGKNVSRDYKGIMQSLMFAFYDGKSYEKTIWTTIKPKAK